MILRDAIDHYVAWRRAHGARFITSARALYQFRKGVPEHVCCDAVTEREVRRFLDGTGPLTRWRAGKYGALAGFYRYAISRGYASGSPLPAADEEPREPASAPPYIYSRKELQLLFEAVDISRKHAIRLDGYTFRTVLLILYGAGLRTSEALNLTMRDVDLASEVLTVRNTKFYKSRLVPVTPSLLMLRWTRKTGQVAKRESPLGSGRFAGGETCRILGRNTVLSSRRRWRWRRSGRKVRSPNFRAGSVCMPARFTPGRRRCWTERRRCSRQTGPRPMVATRRPRLSWHRYMRRSAS